MTSALSPSEASEAAKLCCSRAASTTGRGPPGDADPRGDDDERAEQDAARAPEPPPLRSMAFMVSGSRLRWASRPAMTSALSPSEATEAAKLCCSRAASMTGRGPPGDADPRGDDGERAEQEASASPRASRAWATAAATRARAAAASASRCSKISVARASSS